MPAGFGTATLLEFTAAKEPTPPVGSRVWGYAAAALPVAAAPAAQLEVVSTSARRFGCRVKQRYGSAPIALALWNGVRAGPAAPPVAVPAPRGAPDPSGWPALLDGAGGGAGHLVGAQVSQLAFEPLIRETAGGLLPGVACQWVAGADSWRFEWATSRTWHDGTRLDASAVAAALRDALVHANGLAGRLVGPNDVVPINGEPALEVRVPPTLPLPALLAHPRLGLRSAHGGTGRFRLEVAQHQAFVQHHSNAAPERLALTGGDPLVAFHAGRSAVWQAVRGEAHLSGVGTGAPPPVTTGVAWLVCLGPSSLRRALASIELAHWVATYLPGAEPVTALATLISGEAAAAEVATYGPTLQAGAVGLRVDNQAPRLLVRFVERLEALLIQAGHTVHLEHAPPLGGERQPTAGFVLHVPVTRHPALALWDFVGALARRAPEERPALEAAIVEWIQEPAAERRRSLPALCATIETALDVAVLAQLPLEAWIGADIAAPLWPELFLPTVTTNAYVYQAAVR